MDQETKSPLADSLLIADPSLLDEGFHKSVIHVCEHSKESGAAGYILNKPTDKTVGDVLPGGPFTKLKNIPVYYGGPVGTDHLVFSVYWWDEEQRFRSRLRVSAEDAVRIKRVPGSLLIAHVGYASWYKGQLERELKEQSWISTQISRKTLSVNASHLWKELLEELSPFHRLLSLTPDHVENN